MATEDKPLVDEGILLSSIEDPYDDHKFLRARLKADAAGELWSNSIDNLSLSLS
jgi:hypothetical protein